MTDSVTPATQPHQPSQTNEPVSETEHPKTHAERLQEELKRLEHLKNQDPAAYKKAGGDGEFESLVTQLAIMEAEASLPANE